MRSITSICSAPSLEFGINDPDVWAVRNRPAPTDRDAAIQHYIDQELLSGLDVFAPDFVREFATRVYDRSYSPDGMARQSEAAFSAPDRRPGLAGVRIPVAVIHGRDDRLIGVDGAIATATAVPGADLHVFGDTGHQMRPEIWPDIARIVARTAARAGAPGPAGGA